MRALLPGLVFACGACAALLGIAPPADAGPSGPPPLQIPDVSVGLTLKTTGNYAGGPLAFEAFFANNTPKPLQVEAMFGPPLAGQLINLPAHVKGQPGSASSVTMPFSDPVGLQGVCTPKDYSAQAQGYPQMITIRVTPHCTFATNISDWWSQHSPDRQADTAYVDNPKVTTAPACGRASGDFMIVQVTAFNQTKHPAKGVTVEVAPPNGGAPVGVTPPFDLAATSAATKSIPVTLPATGKLEIKLVDPSHKFAGTIANPGVFVDVSSSCTLEQTVLPQGATLVTQVRPG